MKTENEIIDILYKQYQNQGYVTEQAIFDLCDDNSLSFLSTDRVCNRLLDLGVLISDNNYNSELYENDDIYFFDYSSIDYNVIFSYYEIEYPQMFPIIEYIRSIPPPQRGEIKKLVVQMHSGNKYARTQIIEKYLRNALRIAMKYNEKTTVSSDELFSVACEGLIKAADSYNSNSDFGFSGFASFYISNYITRYIINNQTYIRIPVHLYESYMDICNILNDCQSFNASNNLIIYEYLKRRYYESTINEWYEDIGDRFLI